MNQLEKLTNVPKTFEIDGKEYSVKQLSLLQLSKIRQDVIGAIKDEYKKDISDVIGNLSDKEKGEFLRSSLKAFKVTDEEVSEKLMSRDGIVIVLSAALKITDKDYIVKLMAGDSQDELLEAYQYAASIDVKEPTNGNGEEPKNV